MNRTRHSARDRERRDNLTELNRNVACANTENNFNQFDWG